VIDVRRVMAEDGWVDPRSDAMTETTHEVPLAQKRAIVTEMPGPRSRELFERRRSAVPAGVGATVPVFADRAAGGVVLDVDGNSLIDFGAGIAVLTVGSSAPRVVAAVNEQVARFTHTCFQVTPFESYVALAEKLNALTPGDHVKRTFLVNSGAEAVENAVKIARLTTGRSAVVAFDHAFHGRTLLAMTLTAKAKPYKTGFGPFAPEVYRLPYSYPYRCAAGASPSGCGVACAEAAISSMTKQIGPDKIACVIAEPVLGEGGVIIPGTGFLERIASFCAENGIVMIADEVQAGFARTGRWFSSEHSGIIPDIVVTAKGLGGGLPIGGITGRAEIMDLVHPGGLGSTFGGNPVSCAAALGAIEEVETGDLLARAVHIGEVLEDRLATIAASSPAIGEVRVIGGMAALEFVTDRDSKEPDADAVTRVLADCLSEGLILLRAGTYDNIIRILPPLVIGDDLVDEGCEILAAAVRRL
jgi:4-aminobutyrate aminotransferase/(S)-3-amino-2-methylpropionate transaminase